MSKVLKTPINNRNGRPMRKTPQEMRDLAQEISLPAPLQVVSEHTREAPFHVSMDDIWFCVPRVIVTSGRLKRGFNRDGIFLWPVTTQAEFARSMGEIRSATPQEEAAFWYLDRIAEEGLNNADGKFVLVASRDGRTAEGIFMGSRKLAIEQGFDEEDVPFKIDYTIRADLVFVIPDARKKLVSAGLASAVGLAAQEDLNHIARGMARSGAQLEIHPWVEGQIHSDGGEAFIEDIFYQVDEGYVPAEDVDPVNVQAANAGFC